MISPLFTLREHKALRVIVFITIVMRLALMFRSEERIFTRPFNEDSFYLFSCAEHFAKGEGFTVDGVQPTNGVQPLIVVLYAPLFHIAGFDKLLVLQLAFILVALFDAMSVILIALLIKTLGREKEKGEDTNPLWKSSPIIAALLWATLYPIYVHTACGLETGLYSMLILASLLLYSSILKSRKRGNEVRFTQIVSLGIVLGLTVLARVDAVIFVAMICAYELWKQGRKGLRTAVIIGAVAFIISLPWWWYNYSVFGSVMPQSGTAESLINETERNVWQAITVIGDSLSVFFFLPKAIEVSNPISALWCCVVIGSIYFLLKRTRAWDVLKINYDVSVFIPLVLTSVFFIFYYVFFFSAPHFIPRYFQPIRILTLIIASMLIPVIITHFTVKKIGTYALYGFVVVAFFFSFARYGYYFFTTDISSLYKAGKWALNVPNAKVGMYQSGTAGFLSSNITNLDGKVNYEALVARKEKRVGEYVASMQFDYIVDWQEMVDELTSEVKKYGVHYEFVDSLGRVKIYKMIK